MCARWVALHAFSFFRLSFRTCNRPMTSPLPLNGKGPPSLLPIQKGSPKTLVAENCCSRVIPGTTSHCGPYDYNSKFWERDQKKIACFYPWNYTETKKKLLAKCQTCVSKLVRSRRTTKCQRTTHSNERSSLLLQNCRWQQIVPILAVCHLPCLSTGLWNTFWAHRLALLLEIAGAMRESTAQQLFVLVIRAGKVSTVSVTTVSEAQG